MFVCRPDFLKNQASAPSLPRKGECGSAIFWIFIMIALFGALTYAMSRGTRTGESSLNSEKNRLYVTEIQEYARAVREAVHQLKINGCSDTKISFQNSKVSGYTNGGAPSDKSCHVFEPDGGGLMYKGAETEWLDSAYEAQSGYRQVFFNGALGVREVGTDNYTDDLLLIVPFVSQDICLLINEKNNVPNDDGDPPKEDNTPMADFLVKFVGSYGGGSDIDGYGNLFSSNPFANTRQGCTTASNNDSHYFYQVLIAR